MVISARKIYQGIRDPHLAVTQGLRRAGVFLSTRDRLGTNVFTRDWDLLVILDACRVDAMREVAGEYEFIQKVDSIRSVGAHWGSGWRIRSLDGG